MSKKTFTKKARKDHAEIITAKMLALMESEGTNWFKPWAATATEGQHHNPMSGTVYSGINTFITGYAAMEHGFTSCEWGTFNQWFKRGGGVRCEDTGKILEAGKFSLKGQKATEIIYCAPAQFTKQNDAGDDELVKYWSTKSFFIFNADQVEGYEPKQKKARPNLVEQHTSVDNLVAANAIKLSHGGDRAYYRPSTDEIQMPHQHDFKAAGGQTATQAYYGTLLHEMAHWTGHESRLDRLKGGWFGDENYAAEELVAEIASALLAANLGIEKEPTPNHAKYLNNWMRALKDDKRILMQAFTKAQKACDLILDAADAKPQAMAA